jgi:hypothetical protein
MDWRRGLVTLLVMLALTACAQGARLYTRRIPMRIGTTGAVT